MATKPGEAARFFKEVVLPFRGDECLLWPYAKTPKGYGKLGGGSAGGCWIVSRMACEEFNGPPPSPKHHAAHNCGRGRDGCVNPAHMRWATPKENEADKREHGTLNTGERNGGAKLTEAQARYILSMKGKVTGRMLAKQFGVTFQAISKIHTGTKWAWLSPANDNVPTAEAA